MINKNEEEIKKNPTFYESLPFSYHELYRWTYKN